VLQALDDAQVAVLQPIVLADERDAHLILHLVHDGGNLAPARQRRAAAARLGQVQLQPARDDLGAAVRFSAVDGTSTRMSLSTDSR
jgi:hypothetical protein